jgi:hypothetical protein
MWGGVEEGTTDLEEGEYAMCEATSVSNMLIITNDIQNAHTKSITHSKTVKATDT